MKQTKKPDNSEKEWEPNAPDGEQALTTEERSLDIGQSGQFAPGGYYNQQPTIDPQRTRDDDTDNVPHTQRR